MTEPFVSRFSDLSDSTGWSQLSSGAWVTRLPLLDTANDIFAELSYALAIEAARAFGARLVSAAEVDLINVEGFRLKPVELPLAEWVHGWSKETIDAFRNQNMMGLPWAKIHTEKVREQLADWDGSKVVANAGKHWIDGAPYGRAWLKGWYERGRFTQPGPSDSRSRGPHNDLHHDYGTTTMLAKDSTPP